MNEHDGILHFWSLALRVKRLRRQGWIDRGVLDSESTADHSFGVVLLAWLLAHDRLELNVERVLLLALLHDLPEALAGDVTPFDAVRDDRGLVDPGQFRETPEYSETARLEKFSMESSALDDMIGHLADSDAANIRALWHEYEAGSTPEARFVRQIDKLETLLQAEDYRTRQPDLVVDSFWHGARRDITDSELVHLMKALQSPDLAE